MSSLSCLVVGAFVAVLLVLILVPLSFSYIDYYDYGGAKTLSASRKTTGAVDVDNVYTSGRYMLGPDKKFVKYQADAHVESFENFGVFSATLSNESIGLEFWVDVDFTFFLVEEEIGLLHKQLARNYRNVILSRAREGIKNAAAQDVTFTEFFQNRSEVELLFRKAVQDRWDVAPSLHCELDQFHLGRIRIPQSVARKQIEREQTQVEVNKINLSTNKELRTAHAEASLIKTKAIARAKLIKAQAQINGTSLLLEAAGIESQDHKTVFSYIKTLRDREQLSIDVSYLSEDNVLRTNPL
ncbi:hypothetical protein THAOC_02407 [Thalassiosira oceanica]|uniref:Band 7 domain-containing protein n=1 Tax=Thalassiosira oceanica TaxID=159749 RepID=K0TEM9_THAOC|nr:hypothetical protein THAOC_02407 [Thalassiosira oceanica]|eukprot:EJK75855.1 hypothetical protein THAOC_02407 [Thalassiosira oceanica]